MLESILILQFGIITCLGLKRRYSVLFGLTDNLLETIQENISLMYNSITKKIEINSGKKITIFGCHQYRNGYEH